MWFLIPSSPLYPARLWDNDPLGGGECVRRLRVGAALSRAGRTQCAPTPRVGRTSRKSAGNVDAMDEMDW